ncbi:Nuclear intron maturase 1, mitochondrial [Sesamum alatum]|uniref:Nuclear intron maturase 1, mitochondrial n=1 Tax=Sesamum alatum TaxID=300844 RepID=A0AAE2CZV2_9LAMI|nr:Nuclear intron maturase 1, mitochondrial [Sesamum alatum]
MSLRTKLKHLTGAYSSAIRHLSYQLNHRPYPPPRQDPYSLLKEDPIQVLSDLWVKSFSETHKAFQNLTGFLSKLDLWVLAYQRACAHATGSFPPKNAIPSHALSNLLSLRNAVVRNQFQWNSKVHQFIRGPNDKPIAQVLSKRKLQSMLTSSARPFQDRVVQEVLLMILEPIFEARFSAKSHGFRPGRNPHTVIRTIRSNFAGYLWFIRGDLSGILDNMDFDVVLGCVEKSVKDKKVLNLVKLGLKGAEKSHMRLEDKDEKVTKKKRKKGQTKKRILCEDEPKPDPYWLRTFFDFAPEEAAKVPDYGYCGILSPLLMNVCLSEFDYMMENKILEFFRPCDSDSIWKYSINDGCHNPSWPEFVPSSGKQKTRKMDYIRFAGHFLVGIRGPREDAVAIRKEIIEFCEEKYGIRLDNSKVEIEHITRGIQFLDHIICRRVIHPTLRYTSSGGKIVSEKGVGTLLSVTASLQQCIRQFRRLALLKGDKDPEPLPCTPMLYSGQAHTNSQMNKLLETMADWYRYADNRKKIVGFCAYVIRSSLAKLYAARYRLKSRAKVYKIASRDLSRPLRESSNNAAPEYSDLLRMGLVDVIEGVHFSHMSLIPSCDYTPFPRNWYPDHEKILREYIRLHDAKFFSELIKSVKQQGLSLPQDEISKIVWDYKILDNSSKGIDKADREEFFIRQSRTCNLQLQSLVNRYCWWLNVPFYSLEKN